MMQTHPQRLMGYNFFSIFANELYFLEASRLFFVYNSDIMKSAGKTKLRELGISIVYLFGSKAVGTSSPMSDTDIGVVLKGPMVKDTRMLYNALYDLFAEQHPTTALDIVFLQTAPLPLQYHAVEEGRILFEEDPRITADYAAKVINEYLDFKPVLEYFDAISSERHAHA